MAMIKCPECGKEISSKAEACPNCGMPIRGRQKKEPSSVAKILKIIFGLGAMLCVICGVTVSPAFWILLLIDLVAFGIVGLIGNC